MFIPFNRATLAVNEKKNIFKSLKKKLSGDGEFSNKCNKWFQKNFNSKKTFLTPSCTHALEMSAILIDIKKGDEVIMPSYTFSSSANAFVLRGAKIVFVDIRPDTMNIDETKIEKAISKKTKAILVVHYAGVSCEMDKIMEISRKYKIFVIEDAAQGILSKYKEKYLGTIGHLGAYSFHETKNFTSGGEGGLLIVNDKKFIRKAEIIREKGTNRNLFFRGMVNKYSWVDIGSSYLMNEISAAYLYGNLQNANKINKKRLKDWRKYFVKLKNLKSKNLIDLPEIPSKCTHNAHIFYIKTKNLKTRTKLISHLKKNQIQSTFHYLPLHTSIAGKKFGRFNGVDIFTTKESNRLIRLPMFYQIKDHHINKICKVIYEFFEQ